MKTVNVVAAIICDNIDIPTKVYTTQRGYGDYKGSWEFPGGKIEPGETPEQALIREINEELNMIIRVGRYLDTIEYDYPTFHLSMRCYLCEFISGCLTLNEAASDKWLSKENLYSVEWLPADITIIDKVKECL